MGTQVRIVTIIGGAVGVLLLVIGSSATADKGSITAIGLVALVFGIVWLIEPGAFGELLGVGRESAVLSLIIGGVGLASGLIGRGGPPPERPVA